MALEVLGNGCYETVPILGGYNVGGREREKNISNMKMRTVSILTMPHVRKAQQFQ